MKKIINGKRYDTETAEEMGFWNNSYPRNDFNFCEEILFKKRTGEFFLYGSGGAMSPYNSRSGNSWGWGEAIRPLTVEQAQKWAEEKLEADEYEKIFGEVCEYETRQIVTYSLPIWVIEKIRQEAKDKKMTMSDLITSKFEWEW